MTASGSRVHLRNAPEAPPNNPSIHPQRNVVNGFESGARFLQHLNKHGLFLCSLILIVICILCLIRFNTTCNSWCG